MVTTECLPQTFLKNGGTLSALKDLYGINHRRGLTHPGLVSLKYSMIDSPLGDPLVQQSRGLILDEDTDWQIVARPFDKFFNHGEVHAARIDWDTAQVQEKLDGSLCILYWHDGDWRIGTSGTPDGAGEPKPGFALTFAGLFWQTWNAQGCLKPGLRWRDWTFMFELLTPYNRVVCNQPISRVVFLAARENNPFWDEVGPDEFPWFSHKWQAVKSFPLKSMQDILTTFEHLNPLEQEGYVVVDADFHRLKVKHPGYLALHHLRGDGYGPKRILDMIRSGETAEVLAVFPEWKPDFDHLQLALTQLIQSLEDSYMRLAGIQAQKAFALEALKTQCPAALFSLRKGKVTSFKQFIQEMNIESLLVLVSANQKPSELTR